MGRRLNLGLVCVAHQTWTLKIPTSLSLSGRECVTAGSNRYYANRKTNKKVWALHKSRRLSVPLRYMPKTP